MHSVQRRMGLLLGLAAMVSTAGARVPVPAQPPEASQSRCDQAMLQSVPARSAAAPGGHEFARRIETLSGAARDALVSAELLSGNIPSFLRHLVPVSIPDRGAASHVALTACVLPDYLAIGTDRDFLFVPMGLAAALEVAGRLGFTLPTPEIVDAVYRAATVKLAPLPLPASDQMRSTAYIVHHNDLIAQQRDALRAAAGELTAGDKKDLVLSSRLWSLPGRVAIYGWHRGVDEPIQPLSTVHGARYADYSHGVRLVSDTVYVNGAPRKMAEVLEDSSLAGRLTDEGPWKQVAQRLAALMGPSPASP